MSTTVYEEFTRELGTLTSDHRLEIVYDRFNEKRPDEWGFTLYRPDQSWRYRRVFSASDHEQLNMDAYDVANFIINDIRRDLKDGGVIPL